MPDDNAEIKRLTAQRADLAALAPAWRFAAAVRDSKLTSGKAREAFIVKGADEDPEDYKVRCELASYVPLTPLIAERITGSVFKRPPVVAAPKLDAFAAKATPDGRDLIELVKDACAEALWGRFAVILIDRPPIAAGAEPRTAADDEALGLDKPYAVVYPAPQVLDYRLNPLGLLEYIRLDGPTYARGDAVVREIREVSLTGIQVWRIVNSASGGQTLERSLTPVALADGLRAARRLPVVPVRYQPIDAVQGRSPLAGALIAEQGALRLLADIMFDLWLAGHPTTIVKTLAGELGKIGIGTSKYLKLKPGNTLSGDPGDSIEYLEASLPGLAKQIERYAESRAEIQQQAGVRPLATIEAGAQPESGVAQSIRVDSESYILGNIADMAGDVAFDVLSVVALDMGAIAPEALATSISATYSKDFSLQTVDRLLVTAQTFRSLLGSQSTATKEAIRRAVFAALDNLDAKTEAAIKAEIEAQGAYEPEAPDVEDDNSPFNRNRKNSDAAVPRGPGAQKAAG